MARPHKIGAQKGKEGTRTFKPNPCHAKQILKIEPSFGSTKFPTKGRNRGTSLPPIRPNSSGGQGLRALPEAPDLRFVGRLPYQPISCPQFVACKRKNFS